MHPKRLSAAALIVLLLPGHAVLGSQRSGEATAQRGASVAETWSRVFKTGPGGGLDLSNVAGEITVVGGADGEIRVDAVKTAEAIEIVATEAAGLVRIRTRYPERRSARGEVSFQVRVPESATVTVQSVSGRIDVQKVRGETRLESVSGDIVVADAARLLRTKSVSGNVVVTRCAGENLAASTVSGDVRLKDLEAAGCELQTVSGSLHVERAQCRRADVRSISGNIVFDGRVFAGGRYELNSHSGDIRLLVPKDSGLVLAASTFSGALTSKLALQTAAETGAVSRTPFRRLQGTIGDGGAQVEVRTFSGSFTLDGR